MGGIILWLKENYLVIILLFKEIFLMLCVCFWYKFELIGRNNLGGVN